MSRSNQLAGLLTADPPSALDTINEINTALGNDASLSTTLTNSIATKANKSGDTFTGDVTFSSASGQFKAKTTGDHFPGLIFDRQGTSVGAVVYDTAQDALEIYTDDFSGQPQVTVDNAGKFGIGATSPSSKFHIEGADIPNNPLTKIKVTGNTNNPLLALINENTGGNTTDNNGLFIDNRGGSGQAYSIRVKNNTSEVFAVRANGNVGIGGSPTVSHSGYNGSTLNLYQSGTSSAGSSLRFTSHTSGTNAGDGAIVSYWSDNVLYINNQENADTAFYNNGSETMRIEANGRVGIGTDAPQQHFEVHDSGGLAYILINGGGGDGATTSALQLGGRSASGGNQLAQVSAIRGGDTTGQLAISIKSASNTLTERIRINSSGNVGINTTSPAVKLDVNGDAYVRGNLEIIGNSNHISPANSGLGYLKVMGGGTHNGGAIEFRGGGNSGDLRFFTGTSGAGSERMRMQSGGHIIPGADNTQDFGSSSARWRNIYTGDLHLSNEGSVNDVDGTSGDWTIQEGSEDLFLINNKSGKQYKIKMEEA